MRVLKKKPAFSRKRSDPDEKVATGSASKAMGNKTSDVGSGAGSKTVKSATRKGKATEKSDISRRSKAFPVMSPRESKVALEVGQSAREIAIERRNELAQVVARLSAWAGGPEQALAWCRSQPIPAFGDRTAESLVLFGQAGPLRDYLDSIALGGYA